MQPKISADNGLKKQRNTEATDEDPTQNKLIILAHSSFSEQFWGILSVVLGH